MNTNQKNIRQYVQYVIEQYNNLRSKEGMDLTKLKQELPIENIILGDDDAEHTNFPIYGLLYEMLDYLEDDTNWTFKEILKIFSIKYNKIMENLYSYFNPEYTSNIKFANTLLFLLFYKNYGTNMTIEEVLNLGDPEEQLEGMLLLEYTTRKYLNQV